MNQIAFVGAAYVVAIGATGALTVWAWLSMQRFERAVEAMRRDGR